MSGLKLHIVSFAIPDPPDYGGIIDVYYKIKHLAREGVQLYLHCSQYGGRQPSKQLEAWCEKVWYYPRHTGVAGLSLTRPYIVYSRRSEALLRNLQAVEAPVFFDGLSTAHYLDHPSLSSRLKILRPQNVEQDYYALLAQRTKTVLKKLYYKQEARLLRSYEDQLQAVDAFFTVALHDHDFFKRKYPDADHAYVPSFQPYDSVTARTGSGAYCLYHGNLSVEENEEAALFLLEQVIPQVAAPFILAGKDPGPRVYDMAKRFPHCSVVANPGSAQMSDLIAAAHIHVLPTFQNTGLKLKLLHALFHGRHVLVNEAMLQGTGLDAVCTRANDAAEFREKIKELMQVPFDIDEKTRRERLLMQHYDNRKNAQQLVTYLQRRSL